MGIKEMFSALFATGADIEDNSDADLNLEHKKVLEARKQAEAEVEEPISGSETPKARKGLRKKYEALNVRGISSKENLEKMSKILKGEKEIGE